MTGDQGQEPAVTLTGATKRFGEQLAVNNVSLTIPQGAAFGFLGPNGAGKTTTIKLLMGLLPRDAGVVRVLGRDPAIDDVIVKQRVGYVPEEHTIHRWMRVGEAIRFCRTFYPDWNNTLCDDLLKLFRLDEHKKVRHLSKGMVVKLSLLLALAHEPELLILDEPMAGLDPVAREELLDGVLRTICDRGQTVLFSSHTLSDVQRVADTIGIIHEGKLLVHRDVDELLRGTKRIRAVLENGASPKDPPDGTIWQRVNQREWQLTVENYSEAVVERLRSDNKLSQVEVADIGLEEIFKDYVRGWRASS